MHTAVVVSNILRFERGRRTSRIDEVISQFDQFNDL